MPIPTFLSSGGQQSAACNQAAQSILGALDAIVQQTCREPVIGDMRAQKPSSSFPLRALGKCLLKETKPSFESLPGYFEHADQLTCAEALSPSLPQGHYDQHYAPPVDTPPHEKTRFRSTSSPTAFPAAAQALSNTKLFQDGRSTSWFAAVMGPVEWSATMWASLLTFTGR